MRNLGLFFLFFYSLVSGQNKDAIQIFKEVSPCIVLIQTSDKYNLTSGQGSGVLLSEDGQIATNFHVIEYMHDIYVDIGDGILREAKLIGKSFFSDLAIIDIDGNDFPYMKIQNIEITIGEKTYAIGNPKGLSKTISEGLISGIRAGIDESVQFTAPISPGSSGGALVNQHGQLIGICTSQIKNDYGQNLNFAIPIKKVKNVFNCDGNESLCSEYLKFLVDAVGYYRNGDFESAVTTIEHYINKIPYDKEAVILKDRFLFADAYKNQKFDKMKSYIKKYPDEPEYRYFLASLYFEEDKLNESILTCIEAISNGMLYSQFYEIISESYAKRNDHRAEKHFKNVATNFPRIISNKFNPERILEIYK